MPEPVDVPQETKETISEILRHAASNERAVIEFRTVETDGGKQLNALEITEYLETLEANADEVPEK